jgi:hypothetical protein
VFRIRSRFLKGCSHLYGFSGGVLCQRSVLINQLTRYSVGTLRNLKGGNAVGSKGQAMGTEGSD